MKQIFFLLLFLGGLSFGANAQSCAKMSKKECAAVCAKGMAMAAANAAAADEAIEARTDAESGAVTYVRKDVCPASGKVSYTNVEYCTTSKAFKTVANEKKSCDPAACKKGKAKETKAEVKATKV